MDRPSDPHTTTPLRHNRIVPHSRQSYFGPYFLDEKGTRPELRGQSRVIADYLRKLQEAREEQAGWTQKEEVGRAVGLSVWRGGGQRASGGKQGRGRHGWLSAVSCPPAPPLID